MATVEPPNVKQCCAAFYGSDAARLLLGDSFHPGGLNLTRRLGELLGLSPASRVLDVASGRGTSALALAESFHCQVVGVDLSEENVRLATEAATQSGRQHQVSFQRGDAERLPFEDNAFDAIVCECAFCTFPSKQIAASEFHRVLKPSGLLGLSDLTRTEEAIPELQGLLSWIACIGDAMPAHRYSEILALAGFQLVAVEDHRDALVSMVREIQGKLLGAEIAVALKKLDLPGVDFGVAKQFAQMALQATQNGKLGYAVMISRK
ncbi:MAG: class I SAM-dependent methyltransferase [Acidobacteriaceae bacterium]